MLSRRGRHTQTAPSLTPSHRRCLSCRLCGDSAGAYAIEKAPVMTGALDSDEERVTSYELSTSASLWPRSLSSKTFFKCSRPMTSRA